MSDSPNSFSFSLGNYRLTESGAEFLSTLDGSAYIIRATKKPSADRVRGRLLFDKASFVIPISMTFAQFRFFLLSVAEDMVKKVRALRGADAADEKLDLVVDGKRYAFTLRRLPRLRKIHIRRETDGVYFAQIPAKMSQSEAVRRLSSFLKTEQEGGSSQPLRFIRVTKEGVFFVWNDRKVPVVMERRPRRKTLATQFRAGTVYLLLPPSVSQKAALKWLDTKASALSAWVAGYEKEEQQRRQASKSLREHREVTLYGRTHSIVFEDGIGDEGIRDGKILLFPRRQLLDKDRQNDLILKLIKEDFRRHAEEKIKAKLAAVGTSSGIRFTKLVLSSATRKWGSCSSKGIIRLNWHAVFLTEDLIDYLICHELAHLREMNHSAKFWAVVESYCPNYRDCERRLSAQSMKAFAF